MQPSRRRCGGRLEQAKKARAAEAAGGSEGGRVGQRSGGWPRRVKKVADPGRRRPLWEAKGTGRCEGMCGWPLGPMRTGKTKGRTVWLSVPPQTWTKVGSPLGRNLVSGQTCTGPFVPAHWSTSSIRSDKKGLGWSICTTPLEVLLIFNTRTDLKKKEHADWQHTSMI